MPSTPNAGFYAPYGTFKASTNAAGTTTTFHTTNANAASINIGDQLKVYGINGTIRSIRGSLVTISNEQVDTPGAGTTRFTFTPALGSATASGDEVYDPEIVDVTTWISNNMTKADGILGAFPCSSINRPTGSNRLPNMVIYERDTKNLARWTGAAWEVFANSFRARGRVGFTTSILAGASTADDTRTGPYLPTTFIARQNQWYSIFSSCNIEYTVGGNAEAMAQYYISDGPTVTASGDLIATIGADANSQSSSVNNRGNTVFKFLKSDRQVTVGLFLNRIGMSSGDTVRWSPDQYNLMAIEDIG